MYIYIYIYISLYRSIYIPRSLARRFKPCPFAVRGWGAAPGCSMATLADSFLQDRTVAVCYTIQCYTISYYIILYYIVFPPPATTQKGRTASLDRFASSYNHPTLSSSLSQACQLLPFLHVSAHQALACAISAEPCIRSLAVHFAPAGCCVKKQFPG